MSVNLIINGELEQLIISTDLFLYSTDFTIDQQNKFYWSCESFTAIQNGNTVFAFPDPILIN